MNISELLSDPTFQIVLAGTGCIGAISGALGCFAYLRKQSLVGDVVSHSSLAGIMLFFLASFWITGEGSKSLVILVPGAIAAGVAALYLNHFLTSHPRVRDDSGLGISLAIFFGTGILLLRLVNRADPPIPGRRGLENYIFGQAAAITQSDVITVVVMGLVALVIMILFWKELKLYAFDPMYTKNSGFSVRILDAVLIILLVIGIVVGIQSIGVVLMIAMLVTPAAAARQWTNALGPMVALAAGLGALSSIIGCVISANISKLPTGPVIVLSGIALFVFSLLFSPSRGVLFFLFRSDLAGQQQVITDEEAE